MTFNDLKEKQEKALSFIHESKGTITQSIFYKGLEISFTVSDAAEKIKKEIGNLVERYKDAEPDVRLPLLMKDFTLGIMLILYTPKNIFDKIRGKDNLEIDNQFDFGEIDPEIINSVKEYKSGNIEIDLKDSLKEEIKQFLANYSERLQKSMVEELEGSLRGSFNLVNLLGQIEVDYEDNKDIYDSLFKIVDDISKQIEIDDSKTI